MTPASGLRARYRRPTPAGVAALAMLLIGAVIAPAPAAGPLVGAVSMVGMTVADMDRSLAFYSGVLGFEMVSDVEVTGDAYERLSGVFGLRMRVARLRLGGETIELTEFLAPRGRAMPPDLRSHDRTFQHIAIVVADVERAYRHLRAHRVSHVSPGPQRLPDWNPRAGGIGAFYFKDPDGHVLEIIQFPPDKGDPKWRRPGGRLFLGIDHTAIVVADTGVAVRFYRDVLGLGVTGTSENHGPEQERLNAVFGARLLITTLRAATGPGIELLEYLTPRDGRPLPSDARANDIAHWQTTVVSDDPARLATRLREIRAVFVSPGVVGLADGALGFERAMLVRDPDGHALQVVAPRRAAR